MALGRLPFLASLAQSDRLVDRLIWLRVALDYAAELGKAVDFDDAFLEHFVETLDMAGEFARLDAARRLAQAPAPPASLLSVLSAYGGGAADEILRHAPYLPSDVIAAALADASLSATLAQRDDLDNPTIDALLARGDFATLKTLSVHLNAALTGARLAKLVRIARDAVEKTGDRGLADAVLSRWPSQPEAAALFLYATPVQRKAIMLTAQRAELGRQLSGDRADAASPWLEELEAHALAGRADQFAATLAKALDCEPALADRIAADSTGEALVAALAALGAARDVCVRILTSSDMRDGGDYRRVGALARLQDSLSPAAAKRIVAAMVDAPLATATEPPAGNASGWRLGERRPRPAQAVLRDDPASVRRRRAFSMLAENRKL